MTPNENQITVNPAEAILVQVRHNLTQSVEAKIERYHLEIVAKTLVQWLEGRQQGNGIQLGTPSQTCQEAIEAAGWAVSWEEEDGSVMAEHGTKFYLVRHDGGPYAVEVEIMEFVQRFGPVLSAYAEDKDKLDGIANTAVFALCQFEPDEAFRKSKSWWAHKSDELQFLQGWHAGVARYQAGERCGPFE